MSSPGFDADQPEPIDPTELTTLQRDMLVVLASADNNLLRGSDIRAALLTHDRYDMIYSSQLYPSLDDLAERELIEKGEINTERGDFYDDGRQIRRITATIDDVDVEADLRKLTGRGGPVYQDYLREADIPDEIAEIIDG